MRRAVRFLRKPARAIDRFLQPRLTMFTEGRLAQLAVAFGSLLISALIPFMELVPFSANLARRRLYCFRLVIDHTGWTVALLAFATTGGAMALLGFTLL